MIHAVFCSFPRSKHFNNFLAKCLTKNPESRCSAPELLQHPFVASATDKRPLRALYQVRLLPLCGVTYMWRDTCMLDCCCSVYIHVHVYMLEFELSLSFIFALLLSPATITNLCIYPLSLSLSFSLIVIGGEE